MVINNFLIDFWEYIIKKKKNTCINSCVPSLGVCKSLLINYPKNKKAWIVQRFHGLKYLFPSCS
jgi:hypothetical protein